MPRPSGFALAIDDLVSGIAGAYMWGVLGWQDVKQRYRRSTLGPFWLTISTGIMLGIMGPLYSKLFGQDFRAYFAFLASGFVIWQMIAQTINDTCTAFINAESYIKQVKLPLSIHVLRIVWKNVIFFLHNMLVVVVVLALLDSPVNARLLLFPLGVLAFALNALLYGMILGVICARFRDIPLIVLNIVQAAFFLTPIMWRPGMLGRHEWTVNLNPFYHLIEIMRAPLLGAAPNPLSWPVVGAMTLAGCALALAVLSRYRARVPYWI